MTTDELALRFRQWADAELAFIARQTEAGSDQDGRLRSERVALRRAVAWVESAADVPADERLMSGGVRRDRVRGWRDGLSVMDANQAAAHQEGLDADDGCAPCPDEQAILPALGAGSDR